MHYAWPGNVRELQHAIERAVIMTETPSLEPDDFILSTPRKKSGDLEFDTYNLDEIERRVIEKVMKQNQGNISQAAQELGLNQNFVIPEDGKIWVLKTTGSILLFRVILLAVTIFLLSYYYTEIKFIYCSCHCGSYCYFSDCFTDQVSR